jgi:SprT-like family
MMPSARLPAAPVPLCVQQKAGKLDIHAMFEAFNAQFFDNSLNGVYVEYSKKMTRCAGTCTFLGPHGGCRIGLSEPLLSLRPPEDTISTLLHEAIHASLFLKFGVERDSPDGHGPKFLAEAERISDLAGVPITVYHTFTAEVEAHLRHWWTCARCSRTIKRAMNRAPAPTDIWWPEHARACGGQFKKTHEPPLRPKPPKHGVVAVAAADALPDPSCVADTGERQSKGPMRVHRIDEMFQPRGLGNAVPKGSGSSSARLLPARSDPAPPRIGRLSCPACNQTGFLTESAVNSHLDSCLAGVFQSQTDVVDAVRISVPAKKPLSTPKSAHREDVVIVLGDDDIVPVPPQAEEGLPVNVPGENNAMLVVEETKELADGDKPRGDKDSSRCQTIPREAPCAVNFDDADDDDDDDDNVMHFSRPRDDHNAKAYADTSVNADTSVQALAALMQSNDALDFALGLGSSDGVLDVEVALDSYLRNQPRECISADKPPQLPRLPFQEEPSSHDDLVRELSARLGLWQPNNDPLEAPFAGTAARHGLTPGELLERLHRESKECDDGLLLTVRGRQLFLNERQTLKAPVKRRVQEVWPSNVAVGPESKRSRRGGDRDIPVPELKPAARAPSVTPPPTRPPPRRASSSGGSQSRLSFRDAQASDRGIQSFFRVGPRVLSNTPPIAAETSDVPRHVRAASTVGGAASSFGVSSCPVYDVKPPEAELESHVEACVTALEESHARDANLEKGQSKSRSEANNLDMIDCPICTKPVPRSELELHAPTCMDSAGLAFAF